MNVSPRRRAGTAFVLAASLWLPASALLPHPVNAQIWDRVKQARQKAEELLKTAIRCVADDVPCIEAAKAQKKSVVLTDRDGTVLTDDDGAPITDPAQLPPAATSQGDPLTLDDVPALATVAEGQGVVAFAAPFEHMGGSGTATISCAVSDGLSRVSIEVNEVLIFSGQYSMDILKEGNRVVGLHMPPTEGSLGGGGGDRGARPWLLLDLNLHNPQADRYLMRWGTVVGDGSGMFRLNLMPDGSVAGTVRAVAPFTMRAGGARTPAMPFAVTFRARPGTDCAFQEEEPAIEPQAAPPPQPAQPGPSSLQENRYTATYTAAGGTRTFSGVGLVSGSTISLCSEEARGSTIYMSFVGVGLSPRTYTAGRGQAGQPRVAVRARVPGNGLLVPSAPREGSSVTITSLSDRQATGSLKTVYLDGAVLEAEFRAGVVDHGQLTKEFSTWMQVHCP